MKYTIVLLLIAVLAGCETRQFRDKVIDAAGYGAVLAVDVPGYRYKVNGVCYDSTVQKMPKCEPYNFTEAIVGDLRVQEDSVRGPNWLKITEQVCASHKEYAAYCNGQEPWKVGDELVVESLGNALHGKAVVVRTGYAVCESKRLGTVPCYGVVPLNGGSLTGMLTSELRRQ